MIERLFKIFRTQPRFTYFRNIREGDYEVHEIMRGSTTVHRHMAICHKETDALDIVTALNYAHDCRVI